MTRNWLARRPRREPARASASCASRLSPHADFPAADAGYHNDAEAARPDRPVDRRHPAIAGRTVIGASYEGRELWAVKISDNVGVDEGEPEVLLTAGQHAREHLTIEMALYLIGELTSRYATDPRIRGIVDSREIWIVPNVNPDGSEYDIAEDRYHAWRKNRQPNPCSDFVGTDLNRNWGFKWGCCGGSSGQFAIETYRGAAPFSAPETQALRNFVASRVIGGVQQIKASIDFHAFSELILWPFGHTRADTGPGLTQDDRDTFATLGDEHGPHQRLRGPAVQRPLHHRRRAGRLAVGRAADLRLHVRDVPGDGRQRRLLPADELIGRETSRNREAVLLLLENAACPQAAIGKAGAVLRDRAADDAVRRPDARSRRRRSR